MTTTRWIIEVEKMRTALPNFLPYNLNGFAGFMGFLPGRSGREYQVTIQAKANAYPHGIPKIFIEPWVGTNRLADGSLCVTRQWRPDRDTFAQQALYAAAYLQENG